MLKPDETIKSKLKSVQALWETRVLKQVIDVGEMEGRFGDHRGDMQFVADLLHRSGQSEYRALTNTQPALQVPDPESQAQIAALRASHELTYHVMERQAKTIGKKYEEL